MFKGVGQHISSNWNVDSSSSNLISISLLKEANNTLRAILNNKWQWTVCSQLYSLKEEIVLMFLNSLYLYILPYFSWGWPLRPACHKSVCHSHKFRATITNNFQFWCLLSKKMRKIFLFSQTNPIFFKLHLNCTCSQLSFEV